MISSVAADGESGFGVVVCEEQRAGRVLAHWRGRVLAPLLLASEAWRVEGDGDVMERRETQQLSGVTVATNSKQSSFGSEFLQNPR